MNDTRPAPRPAPGPARPVRELVHVSANLRRDGGGAAHLGRVVGRALRRDASARGLGFCGLHLPASDGGPALDGYRSFGGSRARLAMAVAGLQLRGGSERLLVFDHPGPARVQGWLPHRLRSPYLVWILGIDVWRRLPADLVRALARASKVLAISRTTIARAEPFLPEGCSVEVVYPGIEREAPSGEWDREAVARAGGRFVLVVSRLPGRERGKGHDELLEAWERVVARHAGIQLVVVGDGPDRKRLEARAAELRVAQSVRFLGWVDAVTLAELYRRAAVFALPSTEEGFGLVFLEAMRAGRPCLALAGTAPAEIVIDGSTGLLVPTREADQVFHALDSLLSDPGRADDLGAAGRARFDREFSAESFEKRFRRALDPWLGTEGA